MIEIARDKRLQGMQCVICQIHTDEGISGIGETGVAIGVGGSAAASLLKEMAPLIIGMNPLENEVIWEKLYRNTFWGIGNGAIIMSGISAIDTALWDLKGKILGLPVSVLLGGRHRTKLRAYASQLQMGWAKEEHSAYESPEQLREACLKAVEEGYTAVKVNVLGLNRGGNRRHHLETLGYLTRDILKRAEQRLAAVRDAVGPDVDVILENHAITDANTSLQFAKMAEPYDIMFMEEPGIPTHLDAFRRLSEKCALPLATGERTYLRSGFLPLISSGILSVIQPDIGNCGGVTEFKKIADMAYCYDVAVQAHVCSSPLSVAVALQMEAAIPNFVIHEHHTTNTLPCCRALCIRDYQPVNGYFEVPDLPGFGQELSDFALKNAKITTIQ